MALSTLSNTAPDPSELSADDQVVLAPLLGDTTRHALRRVSMVSRLMPRLRWRAWPAARADTRGAGACRPCGSEHVGQPAFRGRLINCMAWTQEGICLGTGSSLMRTSDGFFPARPLIHGQHLWAKAMAGLGFWRIHAARLGHVPDAAAEGGPACGGARHLGRPGLGIRWRRPALHGIAAQTGDPRRYGAARRPASPPHRRQPVCRPDP